MVTIWGGIPKSSIVISNLGAVKLPEDIAEHVDRLDFVLGVQATAPCNCGVVSYGDKLYINIIRNIKESTLEKKFFTRLKSLGITARIESNQRITQQTKADGGLSCHIV